MSSRWWSGEKRRRRKACSKRLLGAVGLRKGWSRRERGLKLPGADGTAAVTRQRSFPGLLAVGRGCKFQAGGCADGQVKGRSPLDVKNQATQLPMSIRGWEWGWGEGGGRR